MLRVKNLCFSYGKRKAPILKDVSLELEAGEIGILLGKNGAGKTTLFNNLLGILSPNGGSVSLNGEDLLKMPARERARHVAYVPQDIRLGALTVFDCVLTGRVSRFGLRADKTDLEAVEKILADMGLESLALRNANRLSGGERQKVAIARAMAGEPKLLVFDEPTGNLDIANEQLIIEEAKMLARTKGVAVLCSIHDLNRALYFGDKFFFLKDGVITSNGGRDAVTPLAIKSTFDLDVRIVEAENQKIILGGKKK